MYLAEFGHSILLKDSKILMKKLGFCAKDSFSSFGLKISPIATVLNLFLS